MDRTGRRGGRGAAGGACVLAALLLAAAPATAVTRPQLAGSLGRSFAILGSVDEGGPTLSLRALWPVRPAWSAGLSLYANDMGQSLERLLDPNDGTDLGTVGGPSRTALGAGWALDVHPGLDENRKLPGALRRAFLAGTAGYFRVKDTHLGEPVHAEDTFGFSFAGGWRFPVGSGVTLGPSIHYDRVFDDRLGRFMSAGIDWTWR